MRLNPRPAFAAIIRFAFVLTTLSVSAQNSTSVFEQIRPGYDVMEFIARSEFVDDTDVARKEFILALRTLNIELLPLNKTAGSKSSPQAHAEHYATADNAVSFDEIISSDGEYLFEQWRAMNKEIGVRSDISNDFGGKVYLKVKTGNANSAAGMIVFTGRNTMRLAITLPFAVPDTPDKLDASKQSIVAEKFALLHAMLEAMAKAYVKKAEFMYYPNAGGTLTREQRLFGLIQFWTEVKYNFAFFDQVPTLNWDQTLAEYLPMVEKDQTDGAYYQVLAKLCALLKDGHTNIYPPRSVTDAIDAPPVLLKNIQGKPVVSNVAKDLANDLPVGSEITRVDDQPASEYMKEKITPFISSSTDHILADNSIRDLLDGPKQSRVAVSYKTPAGVEKKIALIRNSSQADIEWTIPKAEWKLFEFKRLPGDIAYVALNSFGNQKIVEEFEKKIDEINKCKALIIDLRGNGGGSSDVGYGIINHLTSKPYVGSKWRTREHRPAFKAWGSFQAASYRASSRIKADQLSEWDRNAIKFYRGDMWYSEPADTIRPGNNKKINLPLVVLTGHNTASAAEDFLVALDGLKIATLVGTKTFGSTGQPLPIVLPGGGSARICTKRDEYADGRQFVGFGVKPDVVVENTVSDLINDTDSTLKKGMEVVLKK